MMKQMSGMMGGKEKRGGFKMPFGLRKLINLEEEKNNGSKD